MCLTKLFHILYILFNLFLQFFFFSTTHLRRSSSSRRWSVLNSSVSLIIFFSHLKIWCDNFGWLLFLINTTISANLNWRSWYLDRKFRTMRFWSLTLVMMFVNRSLVMWLILINMLFINFWRCIWCIIRNIVVLYMTQMFTNGLINLLSLLAHWHLSVMILPVLHILNIKI